ncbi:BgtA-20974 [Blumeria graminis f. sp. tritici]|uniref:BgtA-20974 n=2 Tax=Blumeria graminis f. sp. tritici TaxID=62690 RepID=A0A9X9MGI7_BLUGR|nr:hypothetical protein BGT96224_A20974 [Blumeria graminis f. sp. tritici 96224]VDB86303.1 BgtA-20974 [Blumeria graminis f. sp. tritici]
MASSKLTKSPTIKRILREAAELAQSPSPDFHAAPANDSDLFDWHFTIRGPPSSEFSKGIYHGRIVLPPTYPLRPPSFRFLNPSGRFEVNREICLSISGHHEETWMPAWGIRTALMALRTFMETDPQGQLGGMKCTTAERLRYAQGSTRWICNVCQKSNEDIMKECESACINMQMEHNLSESELPNELKIVYRDEITRENTRKIENFGAIDTDSRELEGKQADDVAVSVEQPTPASLSSHSKSSSPEVSLRFRDKSRQSCQVKEDKKISGTSPAWIDLAITVLVICLAAMVIKVLLAL